MPDFDISPLLLALAPSTLGSILLVWHRHGGARWMFALGGFFFILGRLLVATICALMLVGIFEYLPGTGSEGHVIGAVFAIAILGIGGWSIFAMVRVVLRDAFGPAQEDAARFRSTDATRADGP